MPPAPDRWIRDGAVGRAGDVACGDTVRIELGSSDGRITQARHRALRPAPTATAAAALLCGLVERRDLLDAARVGQSELEAELAPPRAATGPASRSPSMRCMRALAAALAARAVPRADGRVAVAMSRRRRLGRRAAEGGRGRARAGRRHAAALDRPRRAGLRAGLLLAAVGAGGARGLPRAGRAALRASTCGMSSAAAVVRVRRRATRPASRRTRACAATAASASTRWPGSPTASARARLATGHYARVRRPRRPHAARPRRRPGQGPVVHARVGARAGDPGARAGSRWANRPRPQTREQARRAGPAAAGGREPGGVLRRRRRPPRVPRAPRRRRARG